MEKFASLTGVAATLAYENIDTDAIIPVRWIVTYGKDLGEGLFGGWRYGPDGAERPDFVLNRAPFRDARILLAGRNFGCGSSREEAVWALCSFGIRCVIAPSFSDIFFENAFKNSLLPVLMAPDDMAALSDAPNFRARHILAVDLVEQRVSVPGSTTSIAFEIDPGRREALLLGLDHVDLTLTHAAAIDSFQADDRVRRPWIHRSGQTEGGSRRHGRG